VAAPTGTTKVEELVTERELPAKDGEFSAKVSVAKGRKA
jgi:hypothetical protein